MSNQFFFPQIRAQANNSKGIQVPLPWLRSCNVEHRQCWTPSAHRTRSISGHVQQPTEKSTSTSVKKKKNTRPHNPKLKEAAKRLTPTNLSSTESEKQAAFFSGGVVREIGRRSPECGGGDGRRWRAGFSGFVYWRRCGDGDGWCGWWYGCDECIAWCVQVRLDGYTRSNFKTVPPSPLV